ELFEQLESLGAGGRVARVVEIDQHEIERARFDSAVHRCRRGHGLDRKALALEQQTQRLKHVELIVDDEDARRTCRYRTHKVTTHPSCNRTTRPPYATFSSE